VQLSQIFIIITYIKKTREYSIKNIGRNNVKYKRGLYIFFFFGHNINLIFMHLHFVKILILLKHNNHSKFSPSELIHC
jgi:hypothetical protein